MNETVLIQQRRRELELKTTIRAAQRELRELRVMRERILDDMMVPRPLLDAIEAHGATQTADGGPVTPAGQPASTIGHTHGARATLDSVQERAVAESTKYLFNAEIAAEDIERAKTVAARLAVTPDVLDTWRESAKWNADGQGRIIPEDWRRAARLIDNQHLYVRDDKPLADVSADVAIDALMSDTEADRKLVAAIGEFRSRQAHGNGPYDWTDRWFETIIPTATSSGTSYVLLTYNNGVFDYYEPASKRWLGRVTPSKSDRQSAILAVAADKSPTVKHAKRTRKRKPRTTGSAQPSAEH